MKKNWERSIIILIIFLLFSPGFYQFLSAWTDSNGISWTDPINLSNNSTTEAHPSIIQTRDGKLWLFYTDYSEIYYMTSDNNGNTWDLHPPITNRPLHDRNPSAVQTSDGRIWVAWNADDGNQSNSEIYYTYSSDGGTTWKSPIQLTDNSYGNFLASIIQTENGRIWIVWHGMGEIFYTYSSDNGNSWSSFQNLTNDLSANEQGPSIYQTSNGDIWIFYTNWTDGEIYYKRSSNNGLTWSSRIRFTGTTKEDSGPAMVQLSNGDITVVWSNGDYASLSYDLYYKKSSNNGSTWSSPERLTFNSSGNMHPTIIQSTDKRLRLFWISLEDVDMEIYYMAGNVETTPQIDLSITEVKSVQVLEDVDFNNDGYTDLIAGKPIAVKVVIESTGRVEDVRVELHFNRENFHVFAICEPWNIDDRFRFRRYTHKLDFGNAGQKTIYFFPDNPYESLGYHVVTAEVVPPLDVQDTNDSNNYLSDEVMVYNTEWDEGSWFPKLYIHYISSDWNSSNDPVYTTYHGQSSDYLNSVLPISPQNFETRANTIWKGNSWSFRNMISNDNRLNNVEFVRWAWALELKLRLSALTADRFISVMPADWFQNFTSQLMASSGVRFSSVPNLVFVQVNDLPKTLRFKTSAHEIGHSYGLRLFCEEYDPCNPTREDEIGNIVQNGLWVEDRMLLNYQQGHSVYCFMGSLVTCDISNTNCREYLESIDYWIDLECYESLFDQKDTSRLRNPQQNSRVHLNKGILISGTIYPDSVRLDNWYLLEGIQTDFLNPGEYYLVLLDDSNSIVYEQSFKIDFTFEGKPLTEVPFAFSIPYIEGTEKVLVKHDETVLAERTVSDNSPVVHVVYPNGEEVVKGTIRIQWDALDADGDELTYAVLFSADGGETWSTLAIDLKGNYYEWDTTEVDDGDEYLVKIIATDSFNTGIDISDATFSVRNPFYQYADFHYVDTNKAIKPLASASISQAESLKEQAYSLLQEAIGKGFDVSEVQALMVKADEFLVDAKKQYSFGNYIAANNLALEAMNLYQQAIEILANR